jgi:hypothetical protein
MTERRKIPIGKPKPAGERWVDPFVDESVEKPVPTPRRPSRPENLRPRQDPDDPSQYILKFGKKFRGYRLEEIPTWYLVWIEDEVEDRKNGMHEAVRGELEKRVEASGWPQDHMDYWSMKDTQGP